MPLVGTTVGRIRILEALGQGGMGTVYVGYDETLERKVALKAIRDERRMDSEARGRFLREARILSQLDHPNICRIHEIIEEERGDFLVLELIEGESLKEAMKEELEDEFKLYVAEQVVTALMVAHEKGIAHRDLKPENIMLADDGGVKVLDFGLAYTVDERLARTPWDPTEGESEAVPESTGENDEDTASEAGVTVVPGIVERMADDDGTDPTVLSRRAGGPQAPDAPDWTKTVPLVAAHDQEGSATKGPQAGSTTHRPEPFVQTEVGTVMGTVAYMSPEQARGERVTEAGDLYSFGLLLQELFTGTSPYPPGLALPGLLVRAGTGQTLPVNGIDPDLAALISHLKTFSAEARPTAKEACDRLRFIRTKPQRRLLKRVAAALLLLLLLGVFKYALDMRRANFEERKARLEAETVSDFLVRLFAAANPRVTGGAPITARALLDNGAVRIREELLDQPQIRSKILLTMGQAYRELGLYEDALPLLEEALILRRDLDGNGGLEVAKALDALGAIYQDLGETGQAEPLLLRSLEIHREELEAEDPAMGASLNNVALFYFGQGHLDRAEALFLEALEVHRSVRAEEPWKVANNLANLGNLYRVRGDHGRAESLLLEALEIQESFLPPDDLNLAPSLNNLAAFYFDQGKVEQAEPLYLRTLEILEKTLGPEHQNVASTLSNLAELYRLVGRYEDAEPRFRRALAIQEGALGPDHPRLTTTLASLADLHRARGELSPAVEIYERIARIQATGLESNHPSLGLTFDVRGDLLLALGDREQAERFYLQALALLASAPAEYRPVLALASADLGHLYTLMGRFADAEELYARSLTLGEQLLAEQPHRRSSTNRLATAQVGLGELFRAMGKEQEAEATFLRAVELMAPLTADSEIVPDLKVHAVALIHLGWGEEAREMVERLLAKGYRESRFLALVGTPPDQPGGSSFHEGID